MKRLKIMKALSILVSVLFIVILSCSILSGFSFKLAVCCLAAFCCTCIVILNYLMAKKQ